MKPNFFWKTVICVVPVLLSIWATVYAWQNDKFKKGVDLEGGTILIYEIDLRKQLDTDVKGGHDSKRDTALLAESLKRRIDPNDLYNIVIRPAGGEGRVEIILPTGGVGRSQKSEAEWKSLLEDMQKEYKLTKLDAPRGRVQELAERIQAQVNEGIWNKKLFNTPEAREELFRNTYLASENPNSNEDKSAKETPPLRPYVAIRAAAQLAYSKDPENQKLMRDHLGVGLDPIMAAAFTYYTAAKAPAILQPVVADDLRQSIDEIKRRVNDYAKEKEIESWFKQQAWETMVERLMKEFPSLAKRKENFENIPFDNVNELIGRAQMLGNPVAQAFPDSLAPLLGNEVIQGSTKDNSEAKDPNFLDRKAIATFVEENYGPSVADIEQKIEAINKEKKRGKDLTVEEVQRIKDLVAKVGSLEFRILANSNDDKDGQKDAMDLLNSPDMKAKLDELRVKGLPPPAPSEGRLGAGKLKEYDLTTLPRNAKSRVTYSWVELGPQERQQLGLHNGARTEPGRGTNYFFMKNKRDRAERMPLPGEGNQNRFYLQGALFFSRECEDRNLPEEERRKKQVEYFVLTRNPELDPETGRESPKIDGSYLVSAVNDNREGRPAVAFTFNTTGGNLFRELTKKNVPSGTGDESTQIKRHLAIILDGLVMSAPTVNSEISTHGQISGSFSPKEVDALVNILRAGALPATLKPQPVSESTMGSTLGEDTVNMGLQAIGWAFAAVLLFMVVYYRFAGTVACVALFANLIITVGIMAATGATFTLPGLAGLVLMLGMAVDANILIYERLREERERGASLALAIRNGYDRALPTIIDTHLSSIFTAVVLYIVGNDQLKGFGISLTTGLVISLFTSLFMTRVIFDYWLHKGWLHKLSMMRLFAKPDFDFMGIRYYWFAATLFLTIAGMTLFLVRNKQGLNIDFVGGTAYGGQLVEGKAQRIEGLRSFVNEDQQKKLLDVVVVEIPDSNGHSFKLSYREADKSFDPKQERSVTLANKPDGDTPEARAEEVRKRASVLPDPSVEQVFPSLAAAQEADPYATRFFNIRTSEKEAELVQATLDRLLQENAPTGGWSSLLKKVQMTYDAKKLEAGRETTLVFTDADNPKELVAASPSFIKTLLVRELLRQFKQTELRNLEFQVELTGEGPTQDGRFAKMKLAFIPTTVASLSVEDVAKIQSALEATKTEFLNRPQPERLETFDSQLAAETRLRAMYAILLSWGAILLYLWFRFGSWTFGLAAVMCLIHDLFFTLGLIAACHFIHGTFIGNLLRIEDFKIDLTAVAALLTLVGYSVNDTIVVFDRIREVRGKNPDLTPQMINDSVNQTLSRTVLASLATWLVVVVLFWLGGPGVHLFAFVMVVGVIVGTYSSIYIASPLLLLFGEGSRAKAAQQRTRDAERAGALETGIQPAN